MAMTKSTVVFLVVVSYLLVGSSASNDGRHGHRRESIEDACSITPHRSLCIRTLNPFSNLAPAHRSIQCWTKAAMSATLAETARVLRYVDMLKSDGRQVKGRRARDALSVCAECLGDARRQLRQSVAELRRLNRRSDFGLSMNSMAMWVSAALTNQDTCVEGLAGWKSQVAGTLRGRVLKTTYFSSNALALLNKLASQGGN